MSWHRLKLTHSINNLKHFSNFKRAMARMLNEISSKESNTLAFFVL
jgi:hypothetical protein